MNVKKIKMPGIIYLLSNAPTHILEEQVMKYYKDSANEKGQHDQLECLIAHTLRKYTIAVAYNAEFTPISFENTALDPDDPESASEFYLIKQLTIDTRINQLDEKYQCYINSKTTEIITCDTLEEANVKSSAIMSRMVEKFRQDVLVRERWQDEELELVIDSINKPLKLKEVVKRSVGRPKNTDPKPKNRIKNTSNVDNNMKIDDFLIKK